MDYVVPVYTCIPLTNELEVKNGFNTIRVSTPEPAHRYETIGELVRMANFENEERNPLRLMLAAKVPGHLTLHAFHVRRVIDLETGRDVVSVRFHNNAGVPVQLDTPFAGYPDDSLIGQLTLLLS